MPTGFQAGSAYSIYSLDLTQFDRDIARVKREIAALQKSTSVPVPSSGGGGASPRAASDQQAADAALRLASARANLARAEGDEARALQILNTALQQNSGATETASLRVQTAAARLQNGTTFAKEFGDGLKSGLLGVVAPAALATAAIGAVTATVQSFVGAFNFKAELDASTASIKSQLDGFRDANATYDEAIAFGRQYNITREETNAILGSSTDILRTSTASVGELETALIRLQSRDVSKPISEASRALRELQAGDTTSIKELFNIPAKDANKMKAEILAGGDAVKVLTNYLDSAKVGMTALGQRTQGAAGKMRELAQAQEDLKLAQADFAQGPGLLILQGQIRTTSGLTRVLSGDFSAMTSSVAQSSNDAAAAVFAWLNAMTGFVPVQQQATAATEQHAAAAAEAVLDLRRRRVVEHRQLGIGVGGDEVRRAREHGAGAIVLNGHLAALDQGRDVQHADAARRGHGQRDRRVVGHSFVDEHLLHRAGRAVDSTGQRAAALEDFLDRAGRGAIDVRDAQTHSVSRCGRRRAGELDAAVGVELPGQGARAGDGQGGR